MTNDNDLLLLASSQNNGTYKVYIDSEGKKTLTPQTRDYTAEYEEPYVCYHYSNSTVKGLLADKNPKEVIFPNCSKISGNGGFHNSFGAFNNVFMRCTSITSVSFPSLITVTGDTHANNSGGGLNYSFYGCTSLTSVSFPSLTTVTGGTGYKSTRGALELAFRDCTSLTSVSFPSLTTATGGTGGSLYNDGAFDKAFDGCTSLTSVSFPSLTTVSERGNTFFQAFIRCSSSLKVHFKKSMKGTEGLDYKTMYLTSADQVVFDLP